MRSPRTAHSRRPTLLTSAVLGAAYLIGYLSTVTTKELFAPDTRYYAAMAFRFGGVGKPEATRLVREKSDTFGWDPVALEQLFGWGLTQPRVVYPGLSAPFVHLFGIPGLAVVPGVAMAVLVALLAALLLRRYGAVAAVGALLLVCTSPLLMFYGSAMLTESLTALWSALIVIVALRRVRRPDPWLLVLLGGLTVLLAFTRQASLIPAGALVIAWLGDWWIVRSERGWRNAWAAPALVVAVTAVGVQLLQMWWFPSFSQADQFMLATGTDSLSSALAAAPELAWSIVRTDVSNLAHADRTLLVLLTLALVSLVTNWRRMESHLLLGALLAYALYNITNGTPTAFRYGMPALVFVTMSVTLLLAQTSSAMRGRSVGSLPSHVPNRDGDR